MITIPTIAELFADIIASLEAEYSILIPTFGKVFLNALAGVQAAKLKQFYLAIGNLQKNTWVTTADPVAQGGTLELFGVVKLGRYPFPATQGIYTATVTGTSGAIIPALTRWKSDDDSHAPGFLYILDVAYTMPSTTGTITLRSLTAGTSALLVTGDTLTATQPIIHVDAGAIIAGVTASPVEAETMEEYRAKAVQAYRLTPQGGSATDYRLWGLDAAGTRQIYPYTWSGHPNAIIVYVEATLADSEGPPYKGVPTPTILAEVVADIAADPVTGTGRTPLGVLDVNVVAIVPLDVDITIDSGGVLTGDQQALITTALTAAIYNIRPFIGAIDIVAEMNDTINTYLIGKIILQVVSVVISSIALSVDGTPVTSYEFDNGRIPYVNSIIFV